jgi:SHS2 domain-containing protein
VTWRFGEHIGEMEVELDSASEVGIFEAALEAFAQLVADGDGLAARREIVLEAGDRALQLVDWLGELVFLAEVERFVPQRVVAIEVSGNGVRATVEGHLGDPRHLVKAVTLNRLRFEQEGGVWRARVVLDV